MAFGQAGIRTKIKRRIRIKNYYIRECLAEFLGTFVLTAMCRGLAAMYVLPPRLNNYLSVNIGTAFSVSIAVWTSIGVSGGLINPAVTLAFAVLGRIPPIKILTYWLGQYIGGFIGAVCVYGIYYDAMNNFDGGTRQVVGENATAVIFASYPQHYVSTATAFGDVLFGSMLLMVGVLALIDPNNAMPPLGLLPFAIGLLLVAIGTCFGSNCGYPLNPAADFSPRLFTAMAGWGTEVFSAYNYYFWVPLVAPHVGCVIGGWLYIVLVGTHIPGNITDTHWEVNTMSVVSSTQVDTASKESRKPEVSELPEICVSELPEICVPLLTTSLINEQTTKN